ncbi:MAG: ribose-phosphate diphosphokinase [Gammaproteobacteria bacterium]|nr:ribose-phosphate diphosphokinase [Gammaproteobacteria bacterium]
MKSLILSSEESQMQAEKLARYIGLEHKTIDVRYFPDGESLVTLPLPLNEHLIVYFNLHNPNAKLIELILACSTARRKGAQRITLITPYLAYMRQDIENHPGEAISQQIIGEMLCNYIDDIITVDPHLHRIENLSQAYPLKNAISLSAEGIIGDYIKETYTDVLLLGPDGESQQWVSAAAERAGCSYGVATKVRQGDRSVVITLPEMALDNKKIVLVDDMISTGGTIIKIASMLKDRHSTIEAAIVTHCLCTHEDEQKILDSGVRKIISTESIPHSTNVISLTHLIGNAVKKII